MKKITILFSLLFIGYLTAYAQREVTTDSIRSGKINPELLVSGEDIPVERSVVTLEEQPVFDQEKMNLEPGEYWIVPWNNHPTYMQPQLFGYDFTPNGLYFLPHAGQFLTHGSHVTYPTMGSFSLADIMYQLYEDNRIGLYAGPYMSKYSLFTNVFQDYGVNARVSLYPTEHFQINWYGGYSARGRENGINKRLSPLYPQNHVGMELEFKPTRNMNFRFGVHSFHRYSR